MCEMPEKLGALVARLKAKPALDQDSADAAWWLEKLHETVVHLEGCVVHFGDTRRGRQSWDKPAAKAP